MDAPETTKIPEPLEAQFKRLTDNLLEAAQVQGQSVLQAMKRDESSSGPDVVAILPVDGSNMKTFYGGTDAFFTVSQGGLTAHYLARGGKRQIETAMMRGATLESIITQSKTRNNKAGEGHTGESKGRHIDVIAGQAGEAMWARSVDATRTTRGTLVEQTFHSQLGGINRTLDGGNLQRLVDASETVKRSLAQ